MPESNMTEPAAERERRSPALCAVRYGIGGAMVLAGIVTLAINPGGFGVDGFAMAVGSGLAVLMLDALYRLGVSGDEERARDEDAWRYFEEHGEWPADPPAPQRQWTLPAES